MLDLTRQFNNLLIKLTHIFRLVTIPPLRYLVETFRLVHDILLDVFPVHLLVGGLLFGGGGDVVLVREGGGGFLVGCWVLCDVWAEWGGGLVRRYVLSLLLGLGFRCGVVARYSLFAAILMVVGIGLLFLLLLLFIIGIMHIINTIPTIVMIPGPFDLSLELLLPQQDAHLPLQPFGRRPEPSNHTQGILV